MAPAPKKKTLKEKDLKADTVAPERLNVLRPIVFNRTAGAAPDPKFVQQRAQQQAHTQALADAFAACAEDHDGGIDVAAVEAALKKGANINAPVNELGQTPLHIAVSEKNYTLAAQLVRAGANTRARDYEGLTPLIRALREGDEDMSGMLARAEERPEYQVAAGRHAIHDAAAFGHVQAIEALIARGLSPTIRDVDGDSPLMEALKNEKTDAALAIAYAGGVQKGMSVDYGQAMSSACGYERGDYTLSDFLEKAAKVTPPALQQQPRTLPQKLGTREESLFALMRYRDTACVQALKKRPDLTVRNDAGDTPLIAALRANLVQVADLVLAKSDVNATGLYGQTALHVAAMLGSNDGRAVMQKLLELGAKVNVQDARGQTPLMLAAIAGCEDQAHLLLGKKAKTEITDNLGFTAKQHACIAGASDVEEAIEEIEAAQKKRLKAQAFKAAAAKPAPKKPVAAKTVAKKPLQKQAGARYR